jgi:sigma-B regulation protein RsbU (phosphoserine phosphatase)
MRQIGGDYLDVTPPREGARWVVLIDVTGHGVAAALAVNRLHGELKRLLAQGVPGPAALLAELNRYVHLTLADESVFATAAACRISDLGVATLANAGHPPPMLRSLTGVRLIDPTAPMLGAFPPESFDITEEFLRLGPEDHLILYTDGATEARSPAGAELGLQGFRRLVEASADPQRLISAVRDHRRGPAEDDVLIAALRAA